MPGVSKEKKMSLLKVEKRECKDENGYILENKIKNKK